MSTPKGDGSRAAASSYSAHERRNGKKKPVAPIREITQAERVSWALTRIRSAQFRANMDKDDRALALAVVARQQEYERELRALDNEHRTRTRISPPSSRRPI